jgi:SAM-dependent methyltransferase
MASHGWQPTGYEPDAGYAESLAQRIGFPMLSGEAALEQHASEFDLVTFNFSFEHLFQPLRYLELAAGCLRPGGEIYIVVPNIESREAAIFKDRWFHLDPPRHITFFTKQLLGDHLRRHGFADINVKNVAVPTGFAGSVSYTRVGKFQPLAWYAGMLPGVLFSSVVRDGNFAISARRTA